MNRGGRQGFVGKRQGQRNPDSQFIKLFYQILQALHHLNILKPQAQGKSRTHAFEQQVKILDNFLKPAQSNSTLKSHLLGLNRMWATKIAQTLCTHYKDRISELMGMIVGLDFSELTIRSLSNQALDWGKHNLKKKLRYETITEYKAIIRSLLPITPKNHNIDLQNSKLSLPTISLSTAKSPFESPRKTTPSKYPIEPTILLSNRFQPLQILDSQPIRTPSKRRMSDSNERDNLMHTPKKHKKQDANQNNVRRSLDKKFVNISSSPITKGATAALNSISRLSKSLSVPSLNVLGAIGRSRSPSPSLRRSLSPGARSLSPVGSQTTSPIIPRQTYATIVSSPTKTGRVTKHNGPKSKWDIPKITSADLIIGDSNLSKMTNLTYKDVQIEAYPGAKIEHMINLIRNYRYQDKPKRIILSVGINDRDTTNTTVVGQSMKDLIKTTRGKFPNSEIFIAMIPISETLQIKNPREAYNLAQFNITISKIQIEGVKALHTGNRDGMVFGRDGIHWSPKSAQFVLQRWYEQMDEIKQDFQQVRKSVRRK
ncbi:hypothetical protein ACJMK2_017460 [Sinanodonta woodiana]|uniref:SGNH hydrolase-type esterase domain-containing protein n=2 Tax=Sinanodonta woodiana TaxID=1069815 RepID=A0ABD3UD61_SINWO